MSSNTQLEPNPRSRTASGTRRYTFSSESVSEGHPDKLADRISDSVLDLFLERDPAAKVACETFVADGFVLVAGEFRTSPPDLFDALRDEVGDLARKVIRQTGYDGSFPGIDPETCEVLLKMHRQSEDIHQGVERGDAIGAGDQGMMFGYASDETPELMPLPIMLAHRLVQHQAELRRTGEIPWLRPDAKSQVAVLYEDEVPVAVESVVLSTQHTEDVDGPTIHLTVSERIIAPALADLPRTVGYEEFINPTGRFVVGGPHGDTGLTGRKIIVDTYGGRCPHGGGAFSGKDPTKVDRSGAYAARWVAKNVVAAGLARRCTVQIAYAIGVVEPTSLMVDTHGTGIVAEPLIENAVRSVFDLSPGGIIRDLDLRRPIYSATAAYGHFGRDLPTFTWEETNRVIEMQRAIDRIRSSMHE